MLLDQTSALRRIRQENHDAAHARHVVNKQRWNQQYRHRIRIPNRVAADQEPRPKSERDGRHDSRRCAFWVACQKQNTNDDRQSSRQNLSGELLAQEGNCESR